MNNLFKAVVGSRKFWAAMIGIVYSVIYAAWPTFPIPEESLIGVVVTIVSYILGTALEDGMTKSAERSLE